MAKSETKVKKYRYNDMDERNKIVNRMYFIGLTALYTMFAAYLLLRLAYGNVHPVFVISNMVIVIAFELTNIIMYFTNKASKKYSMISMILASIELFLLGANTDAQFIFLASVVLIMLQIPYLKPKRLGITAIVGGVMYLLVNVIRTIKGEVTDVDFMCVSISFMLGMYSIWRLCDILKKFNDDALGKMSEQSGKVHAMFKGIMENSEVVHAEVEKSTEMVTVLYEQTQNVTNSMQEISESTNMTARNIEEQNKMTQTIQSAIQNTGERSHKMVTIAVESNESIQENIRVMEELQQQSKVIGETNGDVTEAMVRLQQKTKEVEEIAGMILGISSQTNLLALNASIESARAGEAGRGFAVVADQIRQLAEQTKQSTEQITQIINELNLNADEVVASVGKSVAATESQNEKIEAASVAFAKLNEDMTILITDIEEMDREIGELSESNNVIVDSISQLSAATEEVTANAEQIFAMSQNNLEVAENVKESILVIETTSQQMKQYNEDEEE